MTENRRRALAESSFEAGETEDAEELFQSWLAADPRWGFGWIGWAACHGFRADRPKNYGDSCPTRTARKPESSPRWKYRCP